MDSRNGTYLRRLITSMGAIHLEVPRAREGGSAGASVFGRYKRRTQEIDNTIVSGYVHGASTRDVGQITETLMGEHAGRSTVSRATKASAPCACSVRYGTATSLKRELRRVWPCAFVLAGGFDRAGAEGALREGRADLVAFGRLFLANPDLMTRLERGLPLTPPDFATFYTPGPKGHTDHPKAA